MIQGLGLDVVHVRGAIEEDTILSIELLLSAANGNHFLVKRLFLRTLVRLP